MARERTVDMKRILDDLKNMSAIIRSGKANQAEMKELLNEGRGLDVDTLSIDQVMRLFAEVVNDCIDEKVHIKEETKLHKLLEIHVDKTLKYYFKDGESSWKNLSKNVVSPRDMVKMLTTNAVQWLVVNLINHQFKIRWTTSTGQPLNYTYYEFCDISNNDIATKVLLKYKPRQAHVKATLYRECGVMNIDTLKAITKENLCPTVYIRTRTGWKTWQPTNPDAFEDANFENDLPWINTQIKAFIGENADEQKDDVESLKNSLQKNTLYWAVLKDRDFKAGEHLKLKKIGRTQVYVGKSNNGIKGRWINDSSNHSSMMKKCLDNVCAMTTYDPPRLEGVTLVDARLTLAKVRGEETALFLIKSFGHDNEKAEMAEDDFNEAKRIMERKKNEKSEIEKDLLKRVSKKHQLTLEEMLEEANVALEDATETCDDYEKEWDEAKKAVKKNVSKEATEILLEAAEKLHRKGKRINNTRLIRNIIPYRAYNITWSPKDMRYGMNSC